jgi:hypothetical protein
MVAAHPAAAAPLRDGARLPATGRAPRAAPQSAGAARARAVRGAAQANKEATCQVAFP